MNARDIPNLVCNPDMKPFLFMDRNEWAINDGPSSSQGLLSTSGGRDRKPEPVRRRWTRLHHARSAWTAGKRRELRPFEEEGKKCAIHIARRNFRATEERKKILPHCNDQRLIGRTGMRSRDFG